MTERYDDLRRPFDLDEPDEEHGFPEPTAERPIQKSGVEEEAWRNPADPPERAPWEPIEPYERVPAYAAEDVVEDVEDADDEAELEDDDAEAAASAAVDDDYVSPPVPEVVREEEPQPEPEPAPEHAPAGLDIPDGYRTLEGEPHGDRLAVAVVVSRFNGEITNRMLKRALDELELRGVAKDAVTIAAVPGAFELPLAAMALAKTRRYACVVALGCVIRGETQHFEFISSEAASGLQLAALETGTPVSFGVLTCETQAQAEARIDRADDAVHGALEMADMFSKLRAAAGH